MMYQYLYRSIQLFLTIILRWYTNCQYRLQWIIASVLAMGRTPTHIAFIMDGNRRYAKNHSISTYNGHQEGSKALMKILTSCELFGVKYITVYAFAIENFKRNPDEVNNLMKITEEKIDEFYENREEFNRRKIRIQIWGELTYLPLSLQHKMKSIMNATKANEGKVIFTICFAYSTQCEMLYAAKKLVQSNSCSNEMTCEDYMKSLYSGPVPSPDILIRTSGEHRLSDFLLCQANTSFIYFTRTFWPDFNFYRLGVCILQYQRHRKQMNHIQSQYKRFIT
jgi:ditrans,polycis-polyprenyl diphosphate synthase